MKLTENQKQAKEGRLKAPAARKSALMIAEVNLTSKMLDLQNVAVEQAVADERVRLLKDLKEAIDLNYEGADLYTSVRDGLDQFKGEK